MQHRITALAAGLLLILSSPFAIAGGASLDDVNHALASPEPVVLIGVPAEFLHPESIDDDDAIEAQSDWEYYLGDWMERAKDKLKIIIVPVGVLAQALQVPAIREGGCTTLFVKKKAEGLLNDGDDGCVLRASEYEVGAKWLQGTASPSDIAESGYKLTAIVARPGK